MVSNFVFLEKKWPILAKLGELAERNLHQDPNTTLIKLRMYGELMAKYILAFEKLSEPIDDTHIGRLQLLKREDLLPDEISNIFHTIRKTGNKATHEVYESVQEATTVLKMAFHLGVWFMQTYGEWSFDSKEFVLPVIEDSKVVSEQILSELTDSYETKITKLQEELTNLREQQITQEALQARRKQAKDAASHIRLSEAETRRIIDEKLKAAGWETNTEEITWAKGYRPEKGKNIAIAEWPTKNGEADYALSVGLKLVGVVEAKKREKDVISDVGQAKIYGKEIRFASEENKMGGPWQEYKVPFLFSTNGREYLKQFDTKSGIWFLDARKSTNHPRPLISWYTPQGLLDLFEQDADFAHERLKNEPFTYLMDNLRLRDYQIKAIEKTEENIEKGERSILLAMATGTGKTRTVIGLIYRLIKSKRFNRILFLVDRNALGEQAEDAFKEATMEDLLTFIKIYDVKGIDDKTPDLDTKVHITTVQGMVKRIMYNQDEKAIPSIDQYDCIVVDEAHRGYTLDRELGEVEMMFRNESDYISKYRKVLQYFDAVKIGLTATPAPQTVEIFGKPVFTYSYREAVVDGWLVDHEPPHQIETKLKKEGIKWQKGEIIPVYDPLTGQIANTEELPDELAFDVDQFNKLVITENFNRTVVKELVKYIDPSGLEKTLVFAVTDNHADMVVRLLKEEFEAAGLEVDDDAITKITGSIYDPLGTIRKYKNERLPNTAITVDLLTTGIDVPEICNLVFLRRVRSRILYEQMLGRATRLCDKIKKTHFNIYDAVGLYEVLEPVTNMKPVVVNPKVTFEMLVDELQKITEEELQKRHIETIIAKLQRKQRQLDDKDQETFTTLSGGQTPKEFIEWLRKTPINEIKNELSKMENLILFLDDNFYRPKTQFVSWHEDELIEVTRGYGKGEKPEDYLNEFGRFIKENINKIPALQLVCQRPRELTRQALRELRVALSNEGFTETNLNTAWKAMKNEDIAADIISFIRQQALGDALVSHEERIKNAMKKVRGMQQWTKIQMGWLERIELQLLKETVVDRQSFDQDPFKGEGGFDRINKVFGGELDAVLKKINDNLYPERSTA